MTIKTLVSFCIIMVYILVLVTQVSEYAQTLGTRLGPLDPAGDSVRPPKPVLERAAESTQAFL
jgi:hypothetical protein